MKLMKSKQAVFFLLLIDSCMVLLHIWLGRNFGLFNMDWERNVPTMYQSFKLVLVGSIFLSITIINKFVLRQQVSKINIYWIGLAIILLLMGFDEAAELHETLPFYLREIIPAFTSWYEGLFSQLGFQSSIWIIYVMLLTPIGLIWFLYVRNVVLRKYGKGLYPLLFATIIFFIGAIGFEFIGTLDEIFFSSNYGIMLILEEFLEMVGGTIFVYYAIVELKRVVLRTNERKNVKRRV